MKTFILKTLSIPRDLRGGRRIKSLASWLLWYGGGAAAVTLVLITHQIPPVDWTRMSAVFGFSAVFMALGGLYLRMHPVKGVSLSATRKIVWSTIFLALAGMQIAAHALNLHVTLKAELAPVAVAPIVALGLLVSGLLGPANGIVAATFAALGAGMTGICTPAMASAGWLAASVGAYAVNPLRQRNDLIRAIYVTTLTFAFAALAAVTLEGSDWRQALLAASWGAAGGFGAVAIFWLSVVAFERAFGVVSDWTLLDLINPEAPLIKELMLNAPGTYAHSVMVGNLAEHAAQKIGANGLLCRAMAYYHDIGKSKRPGFFIENNNEDNPHDKLSPALSAKVISAHVRDGLRMADEHRLPQVIKDGIAEHHGTSLISYFYHILARHNGDDPILEQHFRYPGPRPKTKETAVLMLADRVEAITRRTPRTSPGRLRSLVWEIVQDVRDDGQLDDSELNFRDLQIIVDSFVAALGALRHERLEYPGVNIDGFEQETQDISVEQNRQEATSGTAESHFGQDARD